MFIMNPACAVLIVNTASDVNIIFFMNVLVVCY